MNNFKKGQEIKIEKGFKLGLDLKAGTIVIRKIGTMKEDNYIGKNASTYLKPIIKEYEELKKANDKYADEISKTIVDLKNDNWVVFHYIDNQYNPITLPVSIIKELV